jgi:hypothetical protein
MTTKTWSFEIDGIKHNVVLEHALFSGKQKILVDDKIVEESQNTLETGSDHTLLISGHLCSVHIRSKYYGFSYDFSVDGKSISTGRSVPFKSISVSSPYLSEQLLLQARIKIENQIKSGANWFYWIGGLSVLNSLIFIFGGGLSFVVGLGITQLVDVLASIISESAQTDAASLIRTIGLVINIGIALGYVAFGILASRKQRGAIITGMIFYALDAVILFVFGDYISTLFHLLVLPGLYNGLKGCKQLADLEKRMINTAMIHP